MLTDFLLPEESLSPCRSPCLSARSLTFCRLRWLWHIPDKSPKIPGTGARVPERRPDWLKTARVGSDEAWAPCTYPIRCDTYTTV